MIQMIMEPKRSEVAVMFMGVLGQKWFNKSLGGICRAGPIHETFSSQSAGDVHGYKLSAKCVAPAHRALNWARMLRNVGRVASSLLRVSTLAKPCETAWRMQVHLGSATAAHTYRSGNVFTVINTHLDDQSDEQRELAASITSTQAKFFKLSLEISTGAFSDSSCLFRHG